MVATRGTQGKRAADETKPVEGDTKRVKIDEGGDGKEQKTIEESMGVSSKGTNGEKGKNGEEEKNGDQDSSEHQEKTGTENGHSNGKEEETRKPDEKSEKPEKTDEHEKPSKNEKNAFDEVKSSPNDVKKSAKNEEAEKSEAIAENGDSVIQDSKREEAMPSSILEKGIIYFFFRGRVNIEEPHSVDDVARSYMVLRPLPIGAKIGEGPIEDSGNARLLALPKKVLPKSPRDRFLVFVEKAGSTIKDLKEGFMSGSEYATQTVGTSHTPPVSPLAEGVYAITTTGRESHLAYHITIPSPFPTDSKSVQQTFGLNEKGSYVLSAKNPTASGPANAQLDNPAKYPEHIMKKFRNLRWMPLIPELLDYENTQFLIIGEGMGEMDKAMQEQDADKKDEKTDAPGEEMDKLEEEDHARIQHLSGDDKDAVFTDLGLSSKEYPKLETTW